MKHAVVFVDHHEAQIFYPDGTPAGPEGRVRTSHGQRDKGQRPALDRDALDVLCTRLQGVEEILLVGPGSAKTELSTYLAAHHKDVHARVVGTETVDHPTPGELQKLARASFQRIDAFR